MEKVIFEDLGNISYQEAWDYQTSLHREVVDFKLAKRKQDPRVISTDGHPHYLLFCEHPPVYTLGKSGSIDHLLLKEHELEAQGFEYFKINRGGDITYHGPGQIVGYPIFDLDCFFTDVHKYVRYLEEAVIRTLADYGIEGMRIKEYTGVWLEAGNGLPQRKICAIGVHLSRWVTMHGFAFNVNPTLQHFSNIIPCGIDDKDKSVTSMQMELGKEMPIFEVKENLRQQFARLFNFQFAN
ncbi:MAG: octanoyltransferase [Saprospiraceae bacterium]|nr:MAG: octanoyltransferase [Saprospiraceae bacterium]